MDDSRERLNEPLSQTAGWTVYQCVNGCVHVRLKNLTLTFSAAEFARFVELVGGAYVRLAVRATVAGVGRH